VCKACHGDDLAGGLEVGAGKRLQVDEEAVAVYNIAGKFYATQDACTHAGASLSTGELDGREVACPLHGSVFDVTDGRVLLGHAAQPLKTYRVVVDGDLAQVAEVSGNELHHTNG